MSMRNTRVEWAMAKELGYEPITTFWDDFCIAEAFGEVAVRDTYQRVMNEWKDNYEYLTELVMVLNHKIWQYYCIDTDMAGVYNELWETADKYAMENLKGNELKYFISITD